jgi:hypothetical protein
MTRTSAQIDAGARNPDCGGAATYASLRTAAEWHRKLFKEPPTSGWQYVDDDDDDCEVAV